jgi:hypothetical protein
MLGGMAMFFITLFVSQSILENRFGVSYMPGGGSTFLFHSSMNTMVLIVASLYWKWDGKNYARMIPIVPFCTKVPHSLLPLFSWFLRLASGIE